MATSIQQNSRRSLEACTMKLFVVTPDTMAMAIRNSAAPHSRVTNPFLFWKRSALKRFTRFMRILTARRLRSVARPMHKATIRKNANTTGPRHSLRTPESPSRRRLYLVRSSCKACLMYLAGWQSISR